MLTRTFTINHLEAIGIWILIILIPWPWCLSMMFRCSQQTIAFAAIGPM